ncbi:hypothetical protein ACLOJK_027341 [Asimina triloba]
MLWIFYLGAAGIFHCLQFERGPPCWRVGVELIMRTMVLLWLSILGGDGSCPLLARRIVNEGGFVANYRSSLVVRCCSIGIAAHHRYSPSRKIMVLPLAVAAPPAEMVDLPI